MKNQTSRTLLDAAGLTILLTTLLTAPLAYAEWSLLTTTEKRDLFYVDFDTIRYGKYPTAWFLLDFGKRTPEDAMSAKFLVEADCRSRKTRLIQQVYHTSNTGRGGIVKQENTPTEWDKPWPNTPSEEMLKFLCRIR
ncbi:MAG: hypothetical protein RL618_1464 [Pseudomonadota bacterium]|jgi:hypothetical protein